MANNVFPPAETAYPIDNAHIDSLEAYQTQYAESIQDPEAFWATVAERLTWYQKWDTVRDYDFVNGEIKWFEGGTLNACYNCLDRHVEAGHGDATAIIWEGNSPSEDKTFSYSELLTEVKKFANVLKAEGVEKGDRVCIYLQMVPELAIAMLACARIGAVHSIVFGAFSAESLRDRINDSACKMLITQDTAMRGPRSDIPMKANADAAVAECPSIEKVVVVERTGDTVDFNTSRDIWWHEAMADAEAACEPEVMNAEDPLFILYTSGSTGKPKGCFAYHRWLSRLYVLYISTALRALMKEGNTWVEKYDRSTLKFLGTVGEPIKEPEWLWYYNIVGEKRCPIVDTWWQTETGGILMTPLPAATPLKPGSATFPFFGIEPVILDEAGNEVEGNPATGYLCIKTAWPGIMRTVYGDHERFLDTYFRRFPGYYMTGDGVLRDEDGYYWITGRVDDVLNVSGHRLGTAEVEGAIGQHEAVAEAAVVGYPHDIKGQGIYAYVTLMTGESASDTVETGIKQAVRQHIGPIATPDKIQFTPALPKTRSGKIMRRILRKIAEGDISNLGDTSTLADPTVVEALVEGRR
ncbi:Acetyl-coenzyme A synthetase [Geodia barretti]|uniref:acetate--CoA ligase n=1 Tax=Geodia barretti TaxID=519541 RepID=A0AA35S1D5_GEOBA|nr:Acetyl-coenzyme A synthetase [Geodia barretti]